MKKLLLTLATVLSLVSPALAQTLAPLDLPAAVLVNVSSSTFVAQLLTVLVCDATSNNIVVTLPDATQVPAGKGLIVMMVKTGSSHTVSLATINSQTVNTLSASSFNSSYKLTAPNSSLSLRSNGSNWVASAGSL